MIEKIKNTARSFVNLKRIYSSEVFYGALKDSINTKLINQPKKGNVLILAPHPDDEVIGCGGALVKHLRNDDSVRIIYLTDGSLGFEEGFKPLKAEMKEMSERREKEATKLNTLGTMEQIFLRYPDSKLSLSKSLINFLSQTITDFRPDIIYTPNLLDLLYDHQLTSRALAQALKNTKYDCSINQYEVWSPAFCNLYLNIDDVIDQKIEAINFYQSQLKARNYIESVKGLAMYRAVIFGKCKYAESYLSTNSKVFIKLDELSS